MIEPTSPFRTVKTLQKAISLIVEKNVESVISVEPISSPIGRINLDNNWQLCSEIPKNLERRSQNRNVHYKEVGVIWTTKIKNFIKTHNISSGRVKTVLVSCIEAFDINLEEDLALANQIYYGFQNYE